MSHRRPEVSEMSDALTEISSYPEEVGVALEVFEALLDEDWDCMTNLDCPQGYTCYCEKCESEYKILSGGYR